MKINWLTSGVILGGGLICSSLMFAQGGAPPAGRGGRGGGGRGGIMAANPKNANKPFDKHDLSGIWSRNGSPEWLRWRRHMPRLRGSWI